MSPVPLATRRVRALRALLPPVLGALVLLPTLRLGFYQDDFTWVGGAIGVLDHPAGILHVPGHADFRPLAMLTFVANVLVSGVDPAGYALVNLLLHVANVVLVTRLARRVTGRRGPALLAGALFAVAFGNYGRSVVWICGRTGLLAELFVLVALLAHWDWIRDRRRRQRVVALGAFVLALLAKESTVLLVPLLVLVEWCAGGTPRELLDARRQRGLLPFVAILAAYLVFELAYLRRGSPVLGHEYEFGAHALGNFAEYLVRMLVPVNATTMLVAVPPALRAVVRGAEPALHVLVPLAWLAVFIFARSRAIRFGILWMAIGLLPYVWFTFRTDTRYLYDPSIGLCIVAASALAAWQARAERRPRASAATRAAPALLAGALVLAAALALEVVIAQYGRLEAAQDPRLQAALVEQLAAHARGPSSVR